jgi:flavodoxin
MRKLLSLIFTMMMVFTLVGCSINTGSNTQNEKKTESNDVNSQTEVKQTDNSNAGNNGKANKDTNNKRILVAYFSYSGNTKVIANKIHENVGGDIFEIKTVDPYPTDYNAVVDQAKKEQDENYRPKLATRVDNIDSYDVIFVGYPNWWVTMPMTVFSFLEQYNLSGKTIVPFCTHEGSGLGKSVDDMKKTCPKSTILDGLAINGKEINNADKDISKWLKLTVNSNI